MFKIIFPHRFNHHSLQQQKFCSLKSLRSDLFWVFTLFTRLLEIHFHYTLFTLSLSLSLLCLFMVVCKRAFWSIHFLQVKLSLSVDVVLFLTGDTDNVWRCLILES
ncbi:hypothetical protein ACOSP7_019570 [Xanthoceras sorbifolium]